MAFRFTVILLALTLPGVLRAEGPAEPAKDAFTQHIAPFLAHHCVRCHGGTKPKGEVAFDQVKDEAALLQNRLLLDRMSQVLHEHEMPPSGRPKPSATELGPVLTWIDTQLARLGAAEPRNPGRVTIHRLNRAEYNNTIRDLVGVHFQPAEDFPSDDVGYGFDNIADVLSMPPVLIEKYLAAAEKIVRTAFADPELRKRIVLREPTGRDDRDCDRQILERFASRAYRRPARPEEVDRLVRLVALAQENGDSFDKGIQLAALAVLVSPHFLFRIELDPAPNDPNAVRLLNDFELATRLSYFLWSSMPDDELFALAQKGTLRQAGNLEAQVQRMLKDPRAHALTENFGGQWLQLRNLKAATPDPRTYPSFNESLRTAMLEETEHFFEAIIREDRSILEFLDADYTFVNERLARHYGIEGVKGEMFQKVRRGPPVSPEGACRGLAGWLATVSDPTPAFAGAGIAGWLVGRGPVRALLPPDRGGLLTQASILTLTSNPNRTSPVKRGKWILENILGTPPPPPPPDAGELSERKQVVESDSLRKRMERHRANPSCAVCHQRMDPLGFAFENFDGIGAWRTKDGKFDIDASGELPSGQTFAGPAELRAILMAKAKSFRRCFTEKVLTYALGRGLESYDRAAVDAVTLQLAQEGDRFSSLVIAIVRSDPFQKRKGQRGEP
jgi:hypothetical protein